MSPAFRIFSWILGAAAVAMIACGLAVTGAWFSDTSTSNSSMFASGSLDLTLTGDPLQGTNLIPDEDYSIMGSFCSKNDGSMDLIYRGIFKASVDSSPDLLGYLSMKLEIQSPAGWTVEKEIIGGPDNKEVALFDYFLFPGQEAGAEEKYIVNGNLLPGQETCYRLSVKLDGSTPNEMQDKALEFVLHVYATQATNPGWDD